MANSADQDQKPTDLDLHCLQRQGISGFSRTRVKSLQNCFIIAVILNKLFKALWCHKVQLNTQNLNKWYLEQ